MRAPIIILAAVLAGTAIYAAFSLAGDPQAGTAGPVFHATLADAAVYDPDGVYRATVAAAAGTYELRFVPNGDSPRMLGVAVRGDAVMFEETFELMGTPQGNEPAIYYTWEYLGERDVTIGADSELAIAVDPHGDLLGPVSVSLVQK